MSGFPRLPSPRLSSWMVTGWLGAILLVCLFPTGLDTPQVPELCLICGENGTADLVLNFFLYLPLGLALQRATGAVRTSVLIALILSVGIEVAQLWIPGRFTTAGDVLSNVGGAYAGVLLAAHPEHWLFPRARLARDLSAGWAVAGSLTIVASGMLLPISVPGGYLYANWTPELVRFETYRGRVISASIGSRPLPSRLLEGPDEIRQLLIAGTPVVLRFEAGPAPLRRAPLFRVVDRTQREPLRIDIEGTDLVVVPGYLTTRLRLSQPPLRFPDALAHASAGDTVELAVAPDPAGGHQVLLGTGEGFHQGLTAARGWTLLRPLQSRPTLLTFADLLWIAALVVPIGWWAPSGKVLVAGGVAPLLGFWLAPLWTPLLITPAPHYLIAMGGLAVGRFSRRMTESRCASKEVLPRP